MADKRLAWRNAGMVMEIQWIYDLSWGNIWSTRPGGVWRPSTTALFAP